MYMGQIINMGQMYNIIYINLALCKRGGVNVGVAEVSVGVGVGTVTTVIPKY